MPDNDSKQQWHSDDSSSSSGGSYSESDGDGGATTTTNGSGTSGRIAAAAAAAAARRAADAGSGSALSRAAAPGQWYAEEPDDVFEARMRAARAWLAARPETSIAVVSHWGVLYSLTGGVDFENCELRTLRLSQLARL